MNKLQFKKQLVIGFVINLILIFLISSTYFKHIDKSNHFLAKVYLLFSTISHFIFLFLPFLLICILIYYLSKSQILTKVFFVTIATASILILKLDSMVYGQFRYHLSPFVFKLVFGKKATDIFEFSNTTLFIVVIGVVSLILIQILILYIAKRIVKKGWNMRIKMMSIVFVVMLLFTHLIYMWADASYYRPITQIAHVYPLFHPLTAKRFLVKHKIVDLEKVRKNRELYNITSSNSINYPLSKIIAKKPTNSKNILLITIDSWRHDCMDSIITPNIYKLSKKSQNFTNHYSGSNGTDRGIFSMFYGISGLYWEQFTQLEKPPVFIDELIRQKYELSILSSANIQNPPFDKNVFASIPNLRLSSKSNSPSKRDIEITEEWMKIIKKAIGNMEGIILNIK